MKKLHQAELAELAELGRPSRVRLRGSRVRQQTAVGGELVTQLHHQAEADINVIMGRYRTTGHLVIDRLGDGRFGDFTEVGDFLTCQQRLRDAQQIFDALPSDVRSACNNDPAGFIDLCTNPDRAEEARKLGLRGPLLPAPGATTPDGVSAPPGATSQASGAAG